MSRPLSSRSLYELWLRKGLAWFTLLALALPAYASLRELCCQTTQASSCCAGPMMISPMSSMRSMSNSGSMQAMAVSAMADSGVADLFDAAMIRCRPTRASAFSEVVSNTEDPLLPGLSLASMEAVRLPADGVFRSFAGRRLPLSFAGEVPPGLHLFHPLSVSLRI